MIYNNPAFQKAKKAVTYVNYIESSNGTGQYFDTGLSLSSGWRIKAKLHFLPVASATALYYKSQVMWGAHDNSDPYNRNYFGFISPYNLAFYSVGACESIVYTTVNAVFNKDLEFDVSNFPLAAPNLTIDGFSYSSPAGSTSLGRSAKSFYLFRMNYDSDPCPAYMRAYYFEIYDQNDTLLADYRPALDENGVACLYDEVSKSYLAPQGGTFAYG